jgi:hypothetical protein
MRLRSSSGVGIFDIMWFENKKRPHKIGIYQRSHTLHHLDLSGSW